MEQVLRGVNKVMIDRTASGAAGVVPYLPLSFPTPAATPAATPATTPAPAPGSRPAQPPTR
jgi:hypothetical protein